MLMGALFQVQTEIGAGHREIIYQRAVAQAFRSKGISFVEQVRAPLEIDGYSVGFHQFDFIVDGKIVLELKARSHFQTADYRQLTAI